MARYDHQTFETILQRMLDAVPLEIDKREGSVVYDLLAPAAAELAQSYVELENYVDLGFAKTSYGEHVDYRVEEVGLTRKAATKAKGTIEFKGTAGTLIPIGTKVGTDAVEPIYFLTAEEKAIDTTGVASIFAEAELAGVTGNVIANKVVINASDLAGVTSVNNPLDFSGGTDIEEDEALVQRYLERMSKPQSSGNVHDYVKWAKEVEGIGDAKCFPIWNGPGTVKVVLIDSNKRAPLQAKVAETAKYIETQRPVGATLTTVAATEVAINVSATVILEEGYTLTDAQNQLNEAMAYYMSLIVFKENLVRYNFVSSILVQTPAILDYSNLTVNGGTVNVTLTDEQIPILGTVTLT